MAVFVGTVILECGLVRYYPNVYVFLFEGRRGAYVVRLFICVCVCVCGFIMRALCSVGEHVLCVCVFVQILCVCVCVQILCVCICLYNFEHVCVCAGYQPGL